MMRNPVYSYEEWLSGHANRKSMMEKLERSLVPYELLDAIGLRNDRCNRCGKVYLEGNTYSYSVSYDYRHFGHDVYDAELKAVELNNRWRNQLLGYCKFKVVMDHQRIKTIYSNKENYFQHVIDLFENDDYAGLYAERSEYINNVLARYMLLRLLETYRPELQLITSIETKGHGRISVMAADANRNEWVMFAFSKSEAIELAQRLDGVCRRLTVFYFYNHGFEHDGNEAGFYTDNTSVMSVRSYMRSLPLCTDQQLLIERRMLMLVSLLYDEHLEWNFDHIVRVVQNPPVAGRASAYTGRKSRKGKASSTSCRIVWYRRIPRSLLEDALNVLDDKPTTHDDVFHFLCAANLVNSYVNMCNRKFGFSESSINRMFRAKHQACLCLMRLADEHNPNVIISVSGISSVFVNINVDGHDFQFSFRGMDRSVIRRIVAAGCSCNGRFGGVYLQPIAPVLYQYSCLLRWEQLNTPIATAKATGRDERAHSFVARK